MWSKTTTWCLQATKVQVLWSIKIKQWNSLVTPTGGTILLSPDLSVQTWHFSLNAECVVSQLKGKVLPLKHICFKGSLTFSSVAGVFSSFLFICHSLMASTACIGPNPRGCPESASQSGCFKSISLETNESQSDSRWSYINVSYVDMRENVQSDLHRGWSETPNLPFTRTLTEMIWSRPACPRTKLLIRINHLTVCGGVGFFFSKNSRTRSCDTFASVVNKFPFSARSRFVPFLCSFPPLWPSVCSFMGFFYIGHPFKSSFLLAVKRRYCLVQRQSRRADGAHMRVCTWKNTDGRQSFHSFAMIFVCKRAGLDQHLPIDAFTWSIFNRIVFLLRLFLSM